MGEVICQNEKLIWFAIRKYIASPEDILEQNHIEKDDLLQQGRLAFIKAIRAFDVNRGFKFSTYAAIVISREVKRFLRDKGSIIRPTRSASKLLLRISQLQEEMGYLPSVEDLAYILGETESSITKALTIGRHVTPISVCLEDGCRAMLQDETGGEIEDGVVGKLYVDSILDMVRDKVTEKEMEIIEHMLKDCNQTQTAKSTGVSQMRVSRIMKKVAEMLKDIDYVNED
ncbi:RNA polymerase sigma-B factor/RNA polymerase sporulation-specific sigma factor [Anaerovirgula multivorans]|uniref:RNA polymerase sigma-B factor/RNA polymerase sporulation-specific sigma factor n=1 Tax=Anaerovirgula multivorans TaxID=312168 RepID=A0A239CKL1_9FIRM|nr:RNA polymerase sigma-B factor/RNA polymerase sporulation-specific sigma factor [Anaerovirgula multivorans]